MIRSTVENDNFACGVSVYLQKVFDRMNHDILHFKWSSYGIRCVAFDWFKSHISDRSQFIKIMNKKSKSHLGTTTFLLHIKDWSQSLTYFRFHHIVDDPISCVSVNP